MNSDVNSEMNSNIVFLCELDQKRPCIVCLKLFELNGLSCMGINRLIHKLDVLT